MPLFRLTAPAFASALTLAAAFAAPTPALAAPPTGSFAMVHHLPVDGVAEIIAATPDGRTLLYTSADAGALGVVDISDPARPLILPRVDVRLGGVGEPTSVAVTPDGRHAVVALRMDDDVANARRGFLRIYDVRNPQAVRHVKDVSVGIGPDSLALAGRGNTLRAIVAIEDEETDAKGDATLDGRRPGRIDVVGLQDLYGGTSSGLQSIELVDALKALPGAIYPQDPQPEFVSISPDGRIAAVTLQENNAVALVDLRHPRQARLLRVLPAGTVERRGNADLQRDKEINFKDSFSGRREPDAVTWVSKEVFALANEGDGKKGADNSLPGGRGFTLMNTRGAVVYETGERTEQHAALFGHYPDHRSAAKGVEIEGVTSARFGGRPHLLVGSERGSFLEVYEVSDPKQPRFVQLLPTGLSPEGLTTVTRRADGQQLAVTANEVDGSINLYRFHANGAPVGEPQIAARDAGMPWGALSGLATDGSHLYAVPDNAFAQSRIWRLNMAEAAQGRVVIDQVTPLTDNGQPLKVDPEGIARVADGFWIASEGATVDGNELIKVDTAGAVQQRIKLPASVQAKFANAKTGTGYEGVTASADGQTLYMAIQRGYDLSRPRAAILKLHLPTMTWTSALYPLEQHSKDAKTYWMGLSEIQLTEDGRLLLLERDKGGGEGRAIHAEVKRVYSVNAADVAEGAVLKKTLVKDLRKDFQWLHEKAEGMVVFKGDLWVVNDNDGAGWTRLLNAGKP
ncbi:esterase-like activity of phytase family protein [Hydrogenophaga pseudoflava]|uniref:esterase-like activity of phytase family protein n=1 Tax=Hydrogenophaga pseudoflava TaxID=47421 RepID=UPI0027E4557E|nr:esterase-like activity of phytase family protein [Hydrogenophaga pseudoflava]MDQ7743967.1 esterase-like activity of phytase family protein [Hydrogenophaga pseudoflava]